MYFRILRSGFGLAAALVAAVVVSGVPAQAVTTYQVDNRGGACVASRIISASDSGMTSAHYAVTVYDSSARVPASHYTATINTSTYNLSLTFPLAYFPSGHCGVVRLRGLYGSGDTSNASDFSASSTGTGVSVAHQGTYSQRTANGKVYASDIDGSVSLPFNSACIGTVYAYFAGDTGQLTFAHNVGAWCLTPTKAAAVTGSAYPSGSIELGTFSVNYIWIGYWYPSVSRTNDDRFTVAP